jgi:SHS2 domain-containing protein
MAEVNIVDHTADVGLQVRASSPAEAFKAVGEAMFDIMLHREEVDERETWRISVAATDWEDLLVRWLEELLYRYEIDGLVVRRCFIREIVPDHLNADAVGEHLDTGKHQPKIQIKAVTYHQLKAQQASDGFEIQVIFDI